MYSVKHKELLDFNREYYKIKKLRRLRGEHMHLEFAVVRRDDVF